METMNDSTELQKCQYPRLDIVEQNEYGDVLRLEIKGDGNRTHQSMSSVQKQEEYLEAVWRLRHLRHLTIRSITNNTLPRGIRFLHANLKHLYISGCKQMTELPREIGLLQNLDTLTIRNCASLTTLPPDIVRIQQLRTLNLLFCQSLRIPSVIELLRHLKELNVSGCRSLPEDLSRLKSLQSLCLRHQQNAPKLPEWIGKLTNLQSLTIASWSGIRYLPECIGALKNLTALEIDSCPSLETIPPSIWNLQNLSYLKISDCPLIPALPGDIVAPTKDGLDCHLNVVSANDELATKGLDSLILHSLPIRNLPNKVSSWESLTTLKIYYCRSLETLPSTIGTLKRLDSLDLSICPALERLPNEMQGLVKLRSLTLNMCPKLSSIGDLPPYLETLKFQNLPSVHQLPAQIGELSMLKSLIVNDCPNVIELPSSIENLKSLTYLDVSHCRSLEKFPPTIVNLSGLRTLRIGACLKLTTLPTKMGTMTSLKELKISRCTKLTSLPNDLDELLQLEKLDLSFCLRDAVLSLFNEKWGESSPLKDVSFEGVQLGDKFFTIVPNLPRRLTTLDLDDTGITHLDGFFVSPGLPNCITDLDLSNNPVLDSISDHEISLLERLLIRFPCLNYIGTHEESALPAKTDFLLRFNEAGRVLLSDLKPPIPMSLWPKVLARVKKVTQNVISKHDKKATEASILFEFLQGPVTFTRQY